MRGTSDQQIESLVALTLKDLVPHETPETTPSPDRPGADFPDRCPFPAEVEWSH